MLGDEGPRLIAIGSRVEVSPVIAGKRAHAPSLDSHLHVLALADGKQRDKIKLDGPIAGSPAVAAGRLRVGTTRGTLDCFGEKKR